MWYFSNIFFKNIDIFSLIIDLFLRFLCKLDMVSLLYRRRLMNPVFKVIWNRTKGCYVVVAETAKR